jgi:hypothetical protein
MSRNVRFVEHIFSFASSQQSTCQLTSDSAHPSIFPPPILVSASIHPAGSQPQPPSGLLITSDLPPFGPNTSSALSPSSELQLYNSPSLSSEPTTGPISSAGPTSETLSHSTYEPQIQSLDSSAVPATSSTISSHPMVTRHQDNTCKIK